MHPAPRIAPAPCHDPADAVDDAEAALLPLLARLAAAARPMEATYRRGGWLARLVVESAEATPADRPFVPTPFQQGILDALDGKAMRTDALGAAVGDRGRLFRAGGLKELRERGLVQHHERLGFYRADAPPPKLTGRPGEAGHADAREPLPIAPKEHDHV